MKLTILAALTALAATGAYAADWKNCIITWDTKYKNGVLDASAEETRVPVMMSGEKVMSNLNSAQRIVQTLGEDHGRQVGDYFITTNLTIDGDKARAEVQSDYVNKEGEAVPALFQVLTGSVDCP